MGEGRKNLFCALNPSRSRTSGTSLNAIGKGGGIDFGQEGTRKGSVDHQKGGRTKTLIVNKRGGAWGYGRAKSN